MGGPDPGREGRMTFKKRARTILKKAHELAALSGANVYFIIDHPRATVVYNSVEDERRHWPPPDEFLVDLFLRPMSGHLILKNNYSVANPPLPSERVPALRKTRILYLTSRGIY